MSLPDAPPSADNVHDLFAAQARRTPGQTAVRHADVSLTYAELAARARCLAQRLREMGVSRDQAVAVHLPRSTGMIVSLLGVLEAGAAYVPIDPAWPEARTLRVTQDAGPTVVLTTPDSPLWGSDAEPRSWRRLEPRTIATTSEAGEAERGSGGGESLAYIMYTSGSTGAPKGVAMPHRSLCNMLRWHERTRPESPVRRTLQFCSIGFDFSFHEIFSTLCFGGELVLAPDAVRANPVALLGFIKTSGIERAFLPVSVLRQVAEVADAETAPSRLVEVVTTGERLRIDPAMRRLFALTGARLHNHYGATEFQDALTLTLAGDPADWPDLPAAGRPLDGVRVTIRDDGLAPCPVGEPGELYVAGLGVARGYHGRPALTAERFVDLPDDPSDAASPQRRSYRTGDIARRRVDGVIEILGRADDQVKIAGVRVEPAEIEKVLTWHPAIRAAAVIVREGLPGERRLVACVVPIAGADAAALPESVSAFAREHLPGAMVPDAIALLPALPLTASGKVDRRALLDATAPAQRSAEQPRSARAIEAHVRAAWCAALEVDGVGLDDNFFEVGGTSLLAARLHAALFAVYGERITPTTIFRFSTVRSLAAVLSQAERADEAPVEQAPPQTGDDHVAVIGVACRFPGADGPEAFWANLVDGVEALTRFDDEALEQRNPALRDHPDYVKVGFVLDDIEGFDAEFFGYSARDAALLDPQHRILLECAWEAFESAGRRPGRDAGRVGVFAGASQSTYLMNHIAPALGFGDDNPFIEADLRQFQIKMSNDRNYLATRIAYKLDLVGPAINVQSACSTALVAVHLARRSILGGECDLALAGGASLIVPQRGGYLYQEGMVRSPDGHCRAFDVDARGTLLANGVGAVLLKRLSHALRDGDPIVAVIAGSAAGNDGGLKAGYAAPSVEGQARTVASAIRDAGIDSSAIGYVETHGTGTALGDPVEIAGLNAAFRATGRADAPPCPIGSVKTNIGHLDEAAGIAGFIKAALAVQRGRVPPSLHFSAPNPAIDFAGGPFYVNRGLADWPSRTGPRYAGVSAMGVGGTNCHVVLRQAPPREAPADVAARTSLLPLSARSTTALRALAGRYAEHLSGDSIDPLAAVCFTAGVGRTHFTHRLAVRGAEADAVVDALVRFAESGMDGGPLHALQDDPPPAERPRIAFVFPGLGANHIGMGRALYAEEAAFRRCIDRCDALLAETGLVRRALTDVLFSEDPNDGALLEPAYAQPLLFAFQVALAEQLRAWGLEPDVVVGHSAGEFASACLTGVFDLAEGVWLAAQRGQLLERHPAEGGMLAVNAPASRVESAIAEHDALYIAVHNSPSDVVVSGDGGQLEALQQALQADGVRTRRLDVPGAGHSPYQSTMAEAFARVVGERTLVTPGESPALISTVTGQRADRPPAGAPSVTEPRYWQMHSAQTVRFAEAIATCAAEGVDVFVEVGPKPVLSGLVRRCLPDFDGAVVPTLDPRRREGQPVIGDRERLLDAAARLYVHGVDLDWAALCGEGASRRVSLPTYPWQRERHWFEAPDDAPAARRRGSVASDGHPLLGQPLDLPGADDVRFQARVSRDRPAWMRDHRAFGALNMLGMGYLEMALAAGVELFDAARVVVSDLVLEQPMHIAEDGAETAVQNVLRPEPAGYGIEIHAARCGADGRPGEWSRHASGRVTPGSRAPWAAPVDVGALVARCPHAMSIEALRAHEYAAGAMLGDSFWVLDRIHLTAERDAVVAGLRLGHIAGESADERRRYAIHPVYLEACFLSFTTTYPADLQGSAYAPFQIDHVELNRDVLPAPDPDARLWCHLRRRRVDAAHGPPTLMTADLELLDAEGAVVLVARGVHVRRTSEGAMLRSALVPWRDWLYEVQWRPAALPMPNAAGSPDVLVIGDDGPATDRIASAFARGAVQRPALGDDGTLESHRSAIATARDIILVQRPTTDEDGHSGDLTRLLSLCRTIADLGDDRTRRLWVVTFDSWSTPGPTDEGPPLGAAMGGFAEVAALEVGGLRWAQVDLRRAVAGDVERLVTLVSAAHAGVDEVLDQIHLVRDGAVLRPRLVRSTRKALLSPPRRPDARIVVRPDRTYLVTGGLGGIGSKVTEWLAERGARYIVLVGRSAPSAAAQSWLSRLGETVEHLVVRRVDVTRTDAVKALFAEIERTLPPLAGLCHAAGVADDAPISTLAPDALRRVLGPKVDGAWHLHRACEGLELDWFVLFSSASAVLAGAGQAAYVAANRFLDALALHRRARGLPAVSIDWGTWREVGMAAQMDLDAWSRRSGEGTLSPEQGIRALERIIEGAVWARRFRAPSPPQVAVVPVRWDDFLGRQSRRAPLLSEMQVAAPAPEDESALLETLATLPRAARAERLTGIVQGQIARILGRGDPEQITLDTPLADLGFDSLTMIELSRRVSRTFAIRVRSTELYETLSTVERLANHVADQISPTDRDRGTPPTSADAWSGPFTARGGVPLTSPADAAPGCLVTLRGSGAEAPFILFSALGGSAHVFFDLARALRPSLPVWAVEAPETAGHPLSPPSMEGLATLIADELTSRPDRPPRLRLAGFSFGAYVAIETARILVERGVEVEALVAIDIEPAVGPAGEEMLQQELSLAFLARQVDVDPKSWGTVPLDERVRILAERLGADGDCEAVEQEIWQIVAAARRNRTRLSGWSVRDPGVPVTLVWTTEIEASLPAWRRLLGDRLRAVPVPGTHGTCMREPIVGAVARALESALPDSPSPASAKA